MEKRRVTEETTLWPDEPEPEDEDEPEEGSEQTDSRALADVAPAREGWGETEAFEGFVPGLATAGALAAELARVVSGRAELAQRHLPTRQRARWSLEGALAPAALACRDALSREAQIAFDAASLVVAELHAPKAVSWCFEALALRWAASPSTVRRLAVIAVMLGAGRAVVGAAHALGGRPGVGATLAALCEAALAVGDVESGRAALASAAMYMSEAECIRINTLLRKVESGGSPARLRAFRPGTVVTALELLLAPEFDLFDALAAVAFKPKGGGGLG